MKTEQERAAKKAANARWRAANKEKIRAINAAYQAANSDAINERHKQRRAAAPEKVRETNAAQRVKRTAEQKAHIAELNRAWKQANRARVNELERSYYASNPAPAIARKALRRSSVPPTEFDVFVMREAVSLCRLRSAVTRVQWHVDHIVPISKGGDGSAENIQVVPATWNLVKNNRHSGLFFPIGKRAPIGDTQTPCCKGK